MEHREQVRVIEGLLHHLDHGTNVDAGGHLHNPVSSYLDPELAEREWRAFFEGYPNVLGLSADLPEPGSFFTSDDLGKPILCTRTRDGEFRAFLNVCRHRGTIVENEERGQKRAFTCPFHAWTYDHAGKLIGLPKPDHFGDIDRDCHGLVSLPAVERHGLLWVCADRDAVIDVDDLLGPELSAELASWKLEEAVHHSHTTYPHAMNWKLAIDTFGETYHFDSLHRDTLAESFYGNVQMYDTYRRNHRMSLCLRSIDALRDQPRERWNVLHGALPVYYLFPNVQLILSPGGPTLVRVYPKGPNPHDSFSRIGFYLSPFAIEADLVEFVGERLQGFAAVIQAEDYVAAASSHRGARSGALEYQTFGRNEPALHHYHNTYREALGMKPLDPVPA